MFKMETYENYTKCKSINVCVFYKNTFCKCLGTLSLSLCSIRKHQKKGKTNNYYKINEEFYLRVLMGTICLYILVSMMNNVSKQYCYPYD